MATLTVTQLFQLAGTSSATATFLGTLNQALFTTSSSNGDKWLNTGKEIVLLTNSSSQGAAAITVGVTAQAVDNFGGAASIHSLSTSVPTSSGGVTVLGPFSPAVFNDSNGFCNITYSAGGLAVAVLSVAPRS